MMRASQPCKHVVPTLPPLSNENLSSRVYVLVRGAIMDGKFSPGERLRIGVLAKQLGTSSTPVREAIFKLVSERALEMRAATAIHIPVLRPDDLRQIQLMRVALEGAAAERACVLMGPETLTALGHLQERFIAATASDAALAAKLNTEFHFELLRAAQMPLVTATVENLWVMMGPLLRTFHAEMPRREIGGKSHKHYQVLRALKKRDPGLARAAIEEDIRWSDVIIAWLENQKPMAAAAA